MTKLEYLKKQHNLSSAKLSLAAGINYTLLTSIERGERKAYPKVKKEIGWVFQCGRRWVVQWRWVVERDWGLIFFQVTIVQNHDF